MSTYEAGRYSRLPISEMGPLGDEGVTSSRDAP